MKRKNYFCSAILILLCTGCSNKLQGSKTKNDLLFSQKNLVAWCTIPYDSKKRNSEERALMLKDLWIFFFCL